MLQRERISYHTTLGERVLDHRYRYYVLDNPVLEDWEYDKLERLYKLVSKTLGLPDVSADMVGFDLSRKDARAAKSRVDADMDDYSVHQEALHEVWARIGPPKYERKRTQDKGTKKVIIFS